MNTGTPIGTLFSQWAKVGYRFTVPMCQADVDIEQLLVDSAVACRDEPRLFDAAVIWLSHFADLVNISKLLRIVNPDVLPVLGLISDLAVQHGGDSKLNGIIGHSTPIAPARILFNVMTKTQTTANHEKQQCLPQYAKWGFYCSSLTYKDDALHTRHWVLANNRPFAISAVFGTTTRAAILSTLMRTGTSYPKNLSRQIGVSYQPVYAEVLNLLKNGLLMMERVGTVRMVSLSESTKAFLNILPVGGF